MLACLGDCKGMDVDPEEILTPNAGCGDTAGMLRNLAAEERRYREEERRQRDELQRRTAEAQALRRAEEEARRQSQEMAQRVRDIQKAFKEQQALYEQLRRERELLENTAAAKEAEGKRLLEERERWLRKSAVMAFLKESGFASVASSKTVMRRTTFPLHVAAEAGNAKMVDMLLKEGADPEQRNSTGKTAAQVAQAAQAKRGGLDEAHEDVLRVLAGLGRPRSGGA
mmetsp:Transcript_30750/g.84807  ORF Transcript_30750/g.84807 Transcript_30750/m.84807 type:complete len:227 (-) Transcript_30750:290-970(-)